MEFYKIMTNNRAFQKMLNMEALQIQKSRVALLIYNPVFKR